MIIFDEFLFHKNEINFIRELIKPDGVKTYEQYKNKNKLFNNKVFTFLLCILIILVSLFFNSLFMQFIFLVFLSNCLTIYLKSILFTKLIDTFIKYCQSIVHFEDCVRCAIKIITAKENTQNLLINDCLFDIIFLYKRLLYKEEFIPSTDAMSSYLNLKYQSFSFIFTQFEEFYVTKRKLNLEFFIHFVPLYKLCKNLDEIILIYGKSLNKIRSEFAKGEDKNEEKNVVDKIIQNLNSNNKSTVIVDQILDLVGNNNKYKEEYISLAKLIQDSAAKETVLEKFDSILERKYNLLNTIKQIKFNYNNQFSGADNKEKEDDEKEIAKENLDNKNKGVSLYDIELLNQKPKSENNEKNDNQAKKSLITFSHFEIMKRAGESRQLQTNLLYDLEEFQKFKEEKEEETKANGTNGIILENVLN